MVENNSIRFPVGELVYLLWSLEVNLNIGYLMRPLLHAINRAKNPLLNWALFTGILKTYEKIMPVSISSLEMLCKLIQYFFKA